VQFQILADVATGKRLRRKKKYQPPAKRVALPARAVRNFLRVISAFVP
jgi:hypothetical protein